CGLEKTGSPAYVGLKVRIHFPPAASHIDEGGKVANRRAEFRNDRFGGIHGGIFGNEREYDEDRRTGKTNIAARCPCGFGPINASSRKPGMKKPDAPAAA